MLEGLHHVAYRCLDAVETVDFYTNVIGLKFAHAISQDRVPSTQEFSPHLHIFFELGDGSYLAFFELAKAPRKRRLTERGIEVVGPTDHGFCKSIYFFDPERTPNGDDSKDRKAR
jgi:glyoxylase I family protein